MKQRLEELMGMDISHEWRLKREYKEESTEFFRKLNKELYALCGSVELEVHCDINGSVITSSMCVTLGGNKYVNVLIICTNGQDEKGIMFRDITEPRTDSDWEHHFIKYEDMKKMSHRQIAEHIIKTLGIRP